MALTAMEVRSLKPRERPYKLSDSGGLQVWVQPSGQRYCRYAFRWAGRQQTMALGVFSAVSLAEARAKRDAAKKALASGTNPATIVWDEKRAALLAEQAAFKMDEYMALVADMALSNMRIAWELTRLIGIHGELHMVPATTARAYLVAHVCAGRGNSGRSGTTSRLLLARCLGA